MRSIYASYFDINRNDINDESLKVLNEIFVDPSPSYLSEGIDANIVYDKLINAGMSKKNAEYIKDNLFRLFKVISRSIELEINTDY